jgi:hypothetical protein
MRISNSLSELRQQIYHDLRIQHPDQMDMIQEKGSRPQCG